MHENHASKVERWLHYTVIGCFATKTLFSKITLAGIAPVMAVASGFLILGPFESRVLPYVIAVFCILALTAVNAFWRVLPNEGRRYLDMIEDVFGPLTRAEVWKWWQQVEKHSKLDVEAIAKEVGEYQFGDHAGSGNRN